MAESENKTIVFIETKRRVDEITRKMKRDGWPAVCIHGDKTQQERDWVLQGIYERTMLNSQRKIFKKTLTKCVYEKCIFVYVICRFQIGQSTNPCCY